MNIILASELNSLSTSLVRKLIPSGINVIKLNTLEEIEASMPSRARLALIDDENYDIKTLLEMVVRLKKAQVGNRVILLTRARDMHLIKMFIQLGVDEVLQSSLHLDTIAERVAAFAQKIAEQHHSRKYLRIKLNPKDNVTVNFLIPSMQQYVTGKLTDISMGGLAATFSDSEIKILNPGKVYLNARITLPKKGVQADVKLVKTGGKVAAFSYEKMRNTFKDTLSEFVYHMTLSNI